MFLPLARMGVGQRAWSRGNTAGSRQRAAARGKRTEDRGQKAAGIEHGVKDLICLN
jgi:hypothetical protein